MWVTLWSAPARTKDFPFNQVKSSRLNGNQDADMETAASFTLGQFQLHLLDEVEHRGGGGAVGGTDSADVRNALSDSLTG